MTTPTTLGQKNPAQDQAIGVDAAGKDPGKYFGTNAVGQCTPPEALGLSMDLTLLSVTTSSGKPVYTKRKQEYKAESGDKFSHSTYKRF